MKIEVNIRKEKVLLFLSIFIIYSSFVFASDAYPVYKSDVENGTFLIPNWDEIPKKELRALDSWVLNVNNNLNPIENWNYYDHQGEEFYTWVDSKLTASKCLSYSAATVNDWFLLQRGIPLSTYNNFVNNRLENGTNPRELEIIYHQRKGNWSYNQLYYRYALNTIKTLPYGDPVTYEKIPHDIKGYADIILNPPLGFTGISEPILGNSNFEYSVLPDEYLSDSASNNIRTYLKYIPVPNDENAVKRALKRYGPVYAQISSTQTFFFTTWKVPVHAVVIIGYGTYDGENVFWIHDTYDEEYNGSNIDTTYKALSMGAFRASIREAIAFEDVSWPTFHHDNRRTGFTLLKGDTSSESQVDKINVVLQGGDVTEDFYTRASAVDMDDNGDVDVVVAASKDLSGSNGWIYGIEKYTDYDSWDMTRVKWDLELGAPVEVPPTLANIDSDNRLEALVGLENGSLFAIDVPPDLCFWCKASVKWSFDVDPHYSDDEDDYYQGEVGYSAVSDIDLDGTNEIIFADAYPAVSDWEGELYVIRDDGDSAVEEDSIVIGNGGAYGAVSLANIDSDDYLEIVVPTFYGVQVYDYDGSSLSLKWNNSDGKIEGAVVIYDIDRDNEYELIYTTTDYSCASGKTCKDKLYILDALTGKNDTGSGSPISLERDSRMTPAVGDVDDDGDAEIVITVAELSNPTGNIYCYEYNGQNCSGWPSEEIDLPQVSPDIADIDGDGDYEVIIPEYDSENMYILNGGGTDNWNFPLGGKIGSAPAIGDLDGDGLAEIAVKRAGSPITIMTFASGFNKQPSLQSVDNITLIAGNAISLNRSGEVKGFDPDGNPLNYSYGYPFNESGDWQSTINDTGNYSVVIEATDGNLSKTVNVNVVVYSTNTSLQNNFSDGTSQKSLSFSTPENQTIYVKIPKNVSIIHSQIKIKGGNS